MKWGVMIKRDVFRTPEGFNKNLSNVQNDEVCDARDDDSSTGDDKIIL